MTAGPKQIASDAMQLSREERAELAERLWLSLEPSAAVDEAWSLEIERRIKEIDSGVIRPVDHEDVIADLRSRYPRCHTSSVMLTGQ